MESRYYAIEKMGTKKAMFCIKEIVKNGYIVSVNVTNGKRYNSLEKAQKAAKENNWEINKTGDYYGII